MRFFGMSISNTQLKLVKDLVVQRYTNAWREWGDFITHMDGLHSTAAAEKRSTENAEDNLARWLEGLDIEGGSDDPMCAHPHLNSSSLALYHCAHCRNPSAALRKCAGCGKTK